jgi:hypothetical protein
MKLVLNKTFGAFWLSPRALEALALRKGKQLYKQELDGFEYFYTTPSFEESSAWEPYSWDRTDPDLVAVVEELGSAASDGSGTELVIRDIMEGQLYRICEYDGKEWLEFPEEIKWEVAT